MRDIDYSSAPPLALERYVSAAVAKLRGARTASEACTAGAGGDG